MIGAAKAVKAAARALATAFGSPRIATTCDYMATAIVELVADQEPITTRVAKFRVLSTLNACRFHSRPTTVTDVCEFTGCLAGERQKHIYNIRYLS